MVQLDKRLLWHPRQENKFVVGGNSQIILYEWASEYPEIRHLTSQHDLAFMKCFAWSPDPSFEDLMAVGMSSGKVDLIRLEATKQSRSHNILSGGPNVSLPSRSTRICNALAFCTPDPNYLAVGLDKVRNESSLVIWDINSARADLTIQGLQSGHHHHNDATTRVSVRIPPVLPRPQPQLPRIDNRGDPRILQQHAISEVVSSLAFLPESTHILLAGVSNRWLRLFDLRASTPSVQNFAAKVHGIATDPFDPHRIACYGESGVTVWDARKLGNPLLAFQERDALGDGAKQRQGQGGGNGYVHIEFSRTRRACMSTLERDSNYVRFWDLTETRTWTAEGGGSAFGGSSDGESRAGRESARGSTRRGWANLPWPSQSQASNSSRTRDSPVPSERRPQTAFVLADTRRTKSFSRPLASFAMVPTTQTNPLVSNVMIVNKDGDLEMYQVHDTPKQAAWSARGDLTIGAGKGLKVFEGYPNTEEALDGLLQNEGSGGVGTGRQVSSGTKRYQMSEKDRASRSRSAQERADSQRGRPVKLPATATGTVPPTSALFGNDPALSGVSAQLALSSKNKNHRDYSPSPFRKYKVGEHGGVTARGATVSRSRERKVSPGASKRKSSSKGPDLKSKGITAVLEDDISMVMYRRALQGYSLNLNKPLDNMIIQQMHQPSDVEVDPLTEVWDWIHRSRDMLCTPTPNIHGFDFSHQGLLGIWEGFAATSRPPSNSASVDDTPTVVNRSLLDIPAAAPGAYHGTSQERQQAQARRSHSPADDLHGNWNAAITALVDKRGLGSLWKPPVPTTKLMQRQIALQLCGWDLKEDELKNAIRNWERRGQLPRAACWLVFTKQHGKAMELLMKSDDDTHQMMSATIGALSPYASSSLKNYELRDHYARLTKRLQDPYFRMIITHMAVGDWIEVLKEDAIPFRECLTIAFQFLDDKNLTSYLRRLVEQSCVRGNIEGIIVTGLTKQGLGVVQGYVDRTGDVQTAAIMGSYVHPIKFKDNRAEKWLQTYRDLLDGFKLHHERVGFDIERGQLLSDAIQGGYPVSGEWVPRQIMIRCNYCSKPVNAPADGIAAQKGRPTVCPHCSRALPKCSVCLMTLGIVNDASREMELGYTHFKDTIDDAIVICQTCRHGGHAAHILGWFLGEDEDGRTAHGECPVAGCDLRTNGNGGCFNEELYSVTRVRWLYNEEKHRNIRHLPFDVQEFLGIATKAAGATECTEFRKIQEEAFNRSFLLAFDNGVELVAKIPFHIFGPKQYTIASEVATMDFLRTECGVPVPQVRAWCSRAETSPVGVEYIIYEKPPGVTLIEHDTRGLLPFTDDPYARVVAPIQRIQSKLLRKRFSQIGSIYYKEDVSEELRGRPLYLDKDEVTPNAERFRIGPTIDREFWRSGRAELDLDRGPWPDSHSYTKALASCARRCAERMEDRTIREEYHRMISDFEVLAPYLLETDTPRTLWHPEWHAGSIIVSEKKPWTLRGLTDWQGASVGPRFLQVQYPSAYSPEEHPLVRFDPGSEDLVDFVPGVDVDKLTSEEKQQAELSIRSYLRAVVYQRIVRRVDPLLAEELSNTSTMQFATAPLGIITRGDVESLRDLRACFDSVRFYWGFLVGEDKDGKPLVQYPLAPTDRDFDDLKDLLDSDGKNPLEAACDDVLESFGLDSNVDGCIDIEKFDMVKTALEDIKRNALENAPTQEAKNKLEEMWPIRDGNLSLGAQVCY